MPRFLRFVLGAVLLFATIGLVTCQTLLSAGSAPNSVANISSSSVS